MAGITADEGAKVIADLLYLGSNNDRGTSLQLGLFTNADTIGTLKTMALSAITEPSGGGYARKTLTNSNWSVTSGSASYAMQTFSVGSGGYIGQVRGYFIATTGTTPRLLHIEIDPAGPYTLNFNDKYDVTPMTLTA